MLPTSSSQFTPEVGAGDGMTGDRRIDQARTDAAMRDPSELKKPPNPPRCVPPDDVELPGDDHLFFVGDVDGLLDEVEEFLTGTHQAPEGDVVTTSILFTDIVSSTEQSARMGHRKWTTLTDSHNAMVRATLVRHRGLEIKTLGDGFLATFDATTRAVRAALEIVAAAKNMDLEVRAGVHIGEVEVRPDDVVGLAVSIAKRVCDLAGPGQVFVSEAVKGLLVGSGIPTSDHGTRVLKGVPDRWRLFAVDG